MSSSSVPSGFRQPGEWETHRACWLAWPCDASLWGERLGEAQREFEALCRIIADPHPETGMPAGERLEVLVPDEEEEARAADALVGLGARFHRIPFGDIWMRDIAPVFVVDDRGGRAAVRFAFNGWGEKYVLEHDDAVAGRVAAASGLPTYRYEQVLEGGSVEVDGEGTVLTTTQCLLNPNRNPGAPREDIEAFVCEALGASKVLWLQDGLLNDHTDGHIDTIARFVAPGVVVCMAPSGADDPNAEVLGQIEAALREMTDARGRRLRVEVVPSPGLVVGDDGRVMPASYVNFYIANRTVVVPTYGCPMDDAAVAAIARLFPERRVVGSPARAILEGGGAFHCITQQEPS
jgi:agmatine deiminase